MDYRDEIEAFIQENGLSRNGFAKTIGVNPAYLSKYMKEGENYKYASSVVTPAKTFIENYIEKNREKKVGIKSKKLPFVQTKDTKGIEIVLRFAVEDDEMSIVVGDPGTGKSRAVEEWVAKHPEVKLIETTLGMRANELFETIAEKLGVKPKHRKSLDFLIRLCAKELKSLDDGYFIIDEAEKLNHRALEALRRMYDFSQKPLILVGTRQLLQNLTGVGKRDNNEYDQLRSRVSGKWVMQSLVHSTDGEKGLVEVDDDFRRRKL